jgi:hypothetical protein
MLIANDQQPTLLTVGEYTSGEAISGLLRIIFPDARTAVDMTYGKGQFWSGPHRVRVYGCDLEPDRAPDVVANFQAAPFLDKSVDVALFDPPFHTDMGSGAASIMGKQFKTYTTIDALKAAVQSGCDEAKRISRLGVIVKCQDYIHGQRAVWMSEWLRERLGEPYDFLMSVQKRKLRDPKWTRQLSVWRNHSTYWVWRWDGPLHKDRRVSSAATARIERA